LAIRVSPFCALLAAEAHFTYPGYLDEQAFRYNYRKVNDGERFDIVVRQIVGMRLTWDRLTGKDLLESCPIP
jgi:hypothetical protein